MVGVVAQREWPMQWVRTKLGTVLAYFHYYVV